MVDAAVGADDLDHPSRPAEQVGLEHRQVHGVDCGRGGGEQCGVGDVDLGGQGTGGGQGAGQVSPLSELQQQIDSQSVADRLLGAPTRAGICLRLPERRECIPLSHMRGDQFVAGAEVVVGIGDDPVAHLSQGDRLHADCFTDPRS